MRWVAFMPLRGGSKSIPGKNLRAIAGKPLFAWSLEQAIASGCFEQVYVATDSAAIGQAVQSRFPATVTVIDRAPHTATDAASTESAMLDFQSRVAFDVIALIQATSPLTLAQDFRAAKARFIADGLDSLLTAVASKRFYWSRSAQPLNYDPLQRPRRQDFDGVLVENGAFYFTRAEILQALNCRLGGKIGIHEMAAETDTEIDEPGDWALAEKLLWQRRPAPSSSMPVRALVLDVDGTLTDGGMYYGADGEAMKKFNTRDAHGLQCLRDAGIRVAVISAEASPAVAARMRKLGIKDYHPGIRDKRPVLQAQADAWGLSLGEIAYIGDDLGDLECLRAVGHAFCPADAVPTIRAAVDHVCAHAAGAGAVREVCDLILSAIARNA